jgi:oxygen-dependent protoporphyrinogen oxidase
MAGLAAAESLLRRPRPAESADSPRAGNAEERIVTIVEPSGRLGGVLATVRRDGWLVERSADNFLAARAEGLELVERLGLAAELVGVDARVRRALVLHRGRTVPVPGGFRLLAPGSAAGILTTPLLSPLGKLRVLAERFQPPIKQGPDDEDESLEHFAIRRLGREAFERLVQPLVAGIWTADPAKLSMAAACPEFLEMERRHGSLAAGERARIRRTGDASRASGARYGQFVTLACGMETIPLALGRRLADSGARFVTAAVGRLERRTAPDGRPSGWRILLRPSPAATGRPPTEYLDADAVVIATPTRAAADMLSGVDRRLADDLSRIEYAGSAVVSLGYARDDIAHPLDAAGLVVPRSEGRRVLAVSFASSKFPGRAPAGHVLLRVFVGGALDPETAMLDDERLVAVATGELTSLLGARGAPRLVQIDRWIGAMPQYHLGHVQRVAAIRERLEALPGLALAGAAYEGVGIPQVIASGQAAATRLQK